MDDEKKIFLDKYKHLYTIEQAMEKYVVPELVYGYIFIDCSLKLEQIPYDSQYYTMNNINAFSIEELREEYSILLKIAKKLHEWIFIHTLNEDEVFRELGLTEEDNELLGSAGKIIIEVNE